MDQSDIATLAGFLLFVTVALFLRLYVQPKIMEKQSGWKDASAAYPLVNSADGVLLTGYSGSIYFRYGGSLAGYFAHSAKVKVWVTDFGLHFGRPAYFFQSKPVMVRWEKLERGQESGLLNKDRVQLNVAGLSKGHFSFSKSAYLKLLETAGPALSAKNGSLII